MRPFATMKRSPLGLAGLVSVGAHAAFLLLAIWMLGRPSVPTELPVMDVQVLTWPLRRDAERPSPPASAPAPAENSDHQTRPSPAPTPPMFAPEASLSGEAAPPDPGAGVAAALRRASGCRLETFHRLSPAERADCERRLAGREDAPTVGGRLNLAPSGRFTEDAEPYLARRPTKGCKPRAGGASGPMGEQGAAGGLACAWPF